MILADSTYGITIPSEAVTIIIILIVVAIVTNWVRNFTAKPEGLSIKIDKACEEIHQIKSDLKDLRNEINNNNKSDAKIEERIKTIESRFFSVLENLRQK